MNNRQSRTGVHRRDFLKLSVAASGGLLIGFHFPGVSKLASAQTSLGKTFMPTAFVRIGTDERVTVIVAAGPASLTLYVAALKLTTESSLNSAVTV